VLLGVAGGGQVATPSALARRLQMSTETVRRRLMRLAEAGVIRRTGEGYIADDAALDQPVWAAFLQGNVLDAHRLFAGLAERGVIEAWTRLAPPPALPAQEEVSRARF
jgi:DNA-binding Lrp family transcriptional regulator